MAYYDVSIDFVDLEADTLEQAALRAVEQIRNPVVRRLVVEVTEQGTGDDSTTVEVDL